MAASTPIRRGNLCVPPAPGKMPSLTSGSPSAIVAAEGQLEAAAKASAGDRCDHGLVARFDSGDQVPQIGCANRLGAAELADIGSCRKGVALADQYDCADLRIRNSAIETFNKLAPYRKPEAIHRRISKSEYRRPCAS